MKTKKELILIGLASAAAEDFISQQEAEKAALHYDTLVRIVEAVGSGDFHRAAIITAAKYALNGD